MPARELLLLGNPRLYERCAPVQAHEAAALAPVVDDLRDTLLAFRARYGAGRGIAAPQIGVMKRLVYLHLARPHVLVNPVLTPLSDDRFTLWDDCMSFPELLVRVRRHRRCRVVFRDLAWAEHTWEAEGDLAELLQHEVDHLDGILATMRADGPDAFALRSQRALLEGRQIAPPPG